MKLSGNPKLLDYQAIIKELKPDYRNYYKSEDLARLCGYKWREDFRIEQQHNRMVFYAVGAILDGLGYKGVTRPP